MLENQVRRLDLVDQADGVPVVDRMLLGLESDLEVDVAEFLNRQTKFGLGDE